MFELYRKKTKKGVKHKHNPAGTKLAKRAANKEGRKVDGTMR